MEHPRNLYLVAFFKDGSLLGYSKRDDFLWTEYPHNAQFFDSFGEATMRRNTLLRTWKKELKQKEIEIEIIEYTLVGIQWKET